MHVNDDALGSLGWPGSQPLGWTLEDNFFDSLRDGRIADGDALGQAAVTDDEGMLDALLKRPLRLLRGWAAAAAVAPLASPRARLGAKRPTRRVDDRRRLDDAPLTGTPITATQASTPLASQSA